MRPPRKKFSFKRFFIRFTVALVCFYLGICILLFFFQEKLMFHPKPFSKTRADSISKRSENAEELAIKMADGKTVYGWLVKDSAGEKAPLILYYPGNAEEVSHMMSKKKYLKGWHFALMNYRGYGLSEGEPSEEKFFSDALAIYDSLVKRNDIDTTRIIVYGRSIGTGVATYVSHKRKTQGTILVTPYDCMAALAQEQYPFVPVSFMLRHQFNSIAMAPEIKTPCLCVIASEDRTIPPPHAEKLVSAWKGNVTKKIFSGAGHNDIMQQEGYWEELGAFLKQFE
jgi:uncharacterized protein